MNYSSSLFKEILLLPLCSIDSTKIIISFQLVAPSGCLQYWMDSSGWVSSFNYASGASGVVNSIGVQGSRQIASLSYGACVRAAAGMCSITWSRVSFIIYFSWDSN